ncbi:MAG: NACHT domain-containing protein [Nitrospirota bacterium]
MAGIGEKGRDVILSYKDNTVSVIQCKKYKDNLDKTEVAKEIIKFVLHYLKDSSLIPDINNFTYYLTTSTGLSNEATTLLSNFNDAITTDSNLEAWSRSLLKQYIKIGLDYNKIEAALKDTLSRLKVKAILPSDLTRLINNNASIVTVFFEVDKIVDKKAFEEIINGNNLDVSKLIDYYKQGILNNYSRVNFFGLALPNKPREVQLYSLFVRPILKHRGGRLGDFAFFKSIPNVNFIDTSYLLNAMPGGKKFSMASLLDFIHIEREDANLTQKDTADLSLKPLSKLFNSEHNAVILGRPGAGKSLLTKYAICKLIEQDKVAFENIKVYERIPFRIELYKYSRYKNTYKGGIADYLAHQMESDYQLQFISKTSVEKVFENYLTLIFFDALDEILDIQERLNIRNDIENFIKIHSKVRAIVTSRYESYEEVYFKENEFTVYEVQNFNDSQIEEYVNKWYLIEEEDNATRKKEVTDCLIELGKVEDELKRNPLLLSLILILYRNELELPTSKLDVYEGCTKTLVETRDAKEKKLDLNLKIKNKTAVYSSIAYWQYVNFAGEKVKSLSFNMIIKHIKDYLLDKGEFTSDDEAEQAAEEFMEFSKTRSIFVENSFTHKTFLEYFTSYYIFSNYQSKGKFAERDKIIKQYIGQSAWLVVLELLICRIDKEQADYEVIDSIITSQLAYSRNEAVNFFLQIMKYLKNMSPAMMQKIVETALTVCVKDNLTKNTDIIRAINGHLVQLSKHARFEEVIRTAISLIESNLSSPDESKIFYIFILENIVNSASYNKIYTDDMFRQNLENDPYLFILINYMKLQDKDTRFELLDVFIRKFGKYKALQSYRSRYGNNIFDGYYRFNWITTSLFAGFAFKEFMSDINKLSEIGVKVDDIKKAIRTDSGKIALSEKNLFEYLTVLKNHPANSIVKAALLKYYHVKPEVEEPFYLKLSKKGRKFPIPK